MLFCLCAYFLCYALVECVPIRCFIIKRVEGCDMEVRYFMFEWFYYRMNERAKKDCFLVCCCLF